MYFFSRKKRAKLLLFFGITKFFSRKNDFLSIFLLFDIFEHTFLCEFVIHLNKMSPAKCTLFWKKAFCRTYANKSAFFEK